MKKLLLLLFISLGFTASANSVTYDSFGRGSDGSKCENNSRGITCHGGDINGTVRYKVYKYDKFLGSDGSMCEVNRKGKFECSREDKLEVGSSTSNYNSNTISSTVKGVMKGNERMKKGISQMLGVEYKAPNTGGNEACENGSGALWEILCKD